MTINQREIEDELLDTQEFDEVEALMEGRIRNLNIDVRLLIFDLMELCRQYEGQRVLAHLVTARLAAAAAVLDMRQ